MMSALADFAHAYGRRRFACLFFTLLGTMVAAPVFGAMGFGTGIMELFLALNILGAILVTLLNHRAYWTIGVLVLVFAPRGIYAHFEYEPLLLTSQGVSALICAASVWTMLGYVLREGAVTTERIFAALDVYLMVGILCGVLFCILEQQWPNTLSFGGLSPAGSDHSPLAHTIYFSFVTLGTLGYGDITPVSGSARALAVVESVCGQMYLVVVVARLVSLYKGQRDPDDEETRPGNRKAERAMKT